MKVEQENFLRAILRSVQRRRRRSGTRRCIARAKSAFITMALARSSPAAVRTPTARRPSKSTSSTGESVRISTPSRSATRAIATVIAAQPPMRMEDAVFVFEEGEDREQARAAERRHAEVFRLKGKREADARVAEEAAEIGVERLMRPEHRQHLEQARVARGPASRRRASPGTAPCAASFVRFSSMKAAEARRVAGRDRGDLLLHARDVRRGVDLAARAEHDAVLRIEPHHFHLRAERRAGGGEDFLEHARVEEKGRAEIELEAVRLDRRRAPADGRAAARGLSLSPPPRRAGWRRRGRRDRRR